MKLYKNKYRSDTTRLKCWDYTNPWWYYITICAKHHKEWFGEIRNSKIELNNLGSIVHEELKRTEIIRENVELDYYIIMPNHIHAIIIMDNVETTGPVVSNKIEAIHRIASTTLKSNSLGSIIGQFKSVCTKRIRNYGNIAFKWQKGSIRRI